MTIPTVETSEMVERLLGHRLLGDVPRAELEWIAAHGRLRRFEVGEITVSPRTGPVEELYILLSGRLAIHVDRGGGPRKVAEWSGGDATGLLPYSRLTMSPGDGIVLEPMEVLLVHVEHFPEMIRVCPETTTRLVRKMLDRARLFTHADLHNDKMASLGRLSAGIAHELDNPASAVIRSAKLLVPLLDEADSAARAIGGAKMSPDQYDAIQHLRDSCLSAPVQHVRSPLEQARHEETISDWIADRGVSVDRVEALAETPITVGMLDSLAETVDPEALEAALRWVAAGCAVRSLAAELGEASTRISHLVKAVKGFTQMDSGAAPQPTDIELGLTQTLAVLRAKARSRSVRVTITADPDLPRVRGVAGELNQIWANLIDNALDAVAEGGSIEIHARRSGRNVVVTVVDDGPGIPPATLDHIFEPFFTTKPFGHGTGLGLDIVSKLVAGNDGKIEVSSIPGRTEFRVILPIPPEPKEPEAA